MDNETTRRNILSALGLAAGVKTVDLLNEEDSRCTEVNGAESYSVPPPDQEYQIDQSEYT